MDQHWERAIGGIQDDIEAGYLHRYYRRFGHEAMLLAAHAALLPALTPDLVYKLWQNFRPAETDEERQPLSMAVSDLLLSPLCREAGRSIFEMLPGIREALLDVLRAHPDYGMAYLQKLAQFAFYYWRDNPAPVPSPAYNEALRWTAEMYLHPDLMARELIEMLQQSNPNNPRLQRMLETAAMRRRLLERDNSRKAGKDPLGVALNLVQGLLNYQSGRQETGLQQLQHIAPYLRDKSAEKGIQVRLSEDILKAIRIPGDGSSTKNDARQVKLHLLIHEDINITKLCKQLFLFELISVDKMPLYCFPWKSLHNDFSNISFQIWAWNSNLPVPYDRFVLTPQGIYCIILPDEKIFQTDQRDYFIHRIRSQVGNIPVVIIIHCSSKASAITLEHLLGEDFFIITDDTKFDDIIKHVGDVQKTGVTTTEAKVLNKKLLNIAGNFRFEPFCFPFFYGFQSLSPGSSLKNLVEYDDSDISVKEIINSFYANYHLNYKNEIDKSLQLIQGIPRSWDSCWMETESTCISFYLHFIPSDITIRLYYLLTNLGLHELNTQNKYTIYVYGVPIAICSNEKNNILEIRIGEIKDKEWLEVNTFLDRIIDVIYDLAHNYDNQLFYSYDRLKTVFELLLCWSNASFYRVVYNAYREWQEVVYSSINDHTENYINKTIRILDSVYTAIYLKKDTSILMPKVAIEGVIIDAVTTIILGYGDNLVRGNNTPRWLEVSFENHGINESTAEIYSYSRLAMSYPYPIKIESFKTNHIPAHATPRMAPIAGGTFEMGDVMGDKEYDDELPPHEVTLDNYELGAYAVTFAEYDTFCEATGREKPGDQGWGRGDRPVINVDWYDAIEYCNWLSEIWGLPQVYEIDKTKKDPNNKSTSDDKKWLVSIRSEAWQSGGYRLPTEAEWEYAARAVSPSPGGGQGGGAKGGGKVRFGNGKDVADPKEINFDGSKDYKKSYFIVGEYRGKTTPVGAFSPNSLGLYDMSGNVWEWCWDWKDQYPSSPQTNPTGPDSGSFRVLRGGSWLYFPVGARCARRSYNTPVFRGNNLGFRLARAAR